MSMTQTTNKNTAREASRARRRALSASGKTAVKTSQPSATRQVVAKAAKAAAPKVAAPVATAPRAAISPRVSGSAKVASGKVASKARRLAMSGRGKAGVTSKDRSREVADVKIAKRASSSVADAPSKGDCGCGCKEANSTVKKQVTKVATALKNTRRKPIKLSSGRAASYARRNAMSKRGKAGISGKGLSAAQTARATNPDLSSRELAMVLREQRSKSGRCGQKKSEPCGRVRPNKNKNAGAQDAPWKVGASETTQGQTLTGTMVGRSQQVTGDEPSTCRDVTGTEYMGADTFRDFCQAEPAKSLAKVSVTTTAHGNAVSGNKIGRGENVTGNEAGVCKAVTGNEYMSTDETEQFCGTNNPKTPRKVSLVETAKNNSLTGSNIGRAENVTGDELGSNAQLTGSQYMQTTDLKKDIKVPAKVGSGQTLSGGGVSGTMLDRTQQVTGNEAGSCSSVTGDEYIGQEQFKSFCNDVPKPQDKKVGVTATNQGNAVTGVMTSRSQLVTGNEPGTCKSVTGTPYASASQMADYCQADEIQSVVDRSPAKRSVAASSISGIQPAVGGPMTGDSKGAFEAVSGTPYVGADQLSAARSAPAVEAIVSDFPQPLMAAMGGSANVVAVAPQVQTEAVVANAVTGSSYEKGVITGPFGMATGKVTGTEQARFGKKKIPEQAVVSEISAVDGRVKSRVSGEGMETSSKITGDDWDRGKNITGTEGASSLRNPSYQAKSINASTVSVMNMPKRNEEVPLPVSKVTGSSGNTEKGSLVTYSGGARG